MVTGTKEERELGVIHAWMEERGCLTPDEREAQGLLCEVLVSVQQNSPSLLSQFCSPYPTIKSDMSDYLFFLFPFRVSIC